MGQVNYANQQVRGMGQVLSQEQGKNARLEQQVQQMQKDMNSLSQVMSQLKGERSGDPEHVRYIEQIPGRRIPFDLMVNIPIGANITAEQQASTTISQDGPFIAVARYAVFQSAYTFSFTDPGSGNVTNFQGRSFGRLRPVHSVSDLLDGQQPLQPIVGVAAPGTGAGIFASPSNNSNFRTMEFDGAVTFQNQGSGFQRQNTQLPSNFYVQELNSPFPLGALDFFERGEVLSWRVTPLHVNNPPAGSVFGFAAGGFYPFVDSQYDVHEGILDPFIDAQQTDPVARLPEGILIIGFHGYRIIQPPGPVSN